MIIVGRKRMIAFAAILISLGTVLVPLGIQANQTPAVASGNEAPMYAYTSANSGRYSFKITASDNPTTITTVGDIGVQCGNMNLANNAGTKIYQSYNCNGSNKQFTVIDVATNTFASYVVSERTHTMAISPDDRYMYFADPYYTFKWDLSTTPPTYVLGGSRDDNNAGLNLGILPNGQKIYSASTQRSKVEVFNTNLVRVATVTDPAFSSLRWTVPNPSGTEVWVGFGSTYKIIDTATDTISRTITATFGTGALPSFSADGNYLYTTSGAGVEKVNTATGLSEQTYTGTGLANGTHASISPNGKYVYVANGSTVGWVNLTSGLTGSITLPTTTPTETTKTIAWAMPLAAPAISLSVTTVTAESNTALGNSYTISNSGGAVASYSLMPALPTGLNFDTSTGLISGTPTAVMSSTSYALTATNVSGSSTATFTLQVNNPTPTQSPTPATEPTPSATSVTVATQPVKEIIVKSKPSLSPSPSSTAKPEVNVSVIPTPTVSQSSELSMQPQANPVRQTNYLSAGGIVAAMLVLTAIWIYQKQK